MIRKKNNNSNEEIETDMEEDDEYFEDNNDEALDEGLGDIEENKRYDMFDETYDEFDTGIRNLPDVHRIWLDTSPHIRDLYLSLTNQVIKKIKYMKEGKAYYKTKMVPIKYKDQEGKEVILKPLANERGISQIMSTFKAFISSPLVQGNLTEKQYHKQMLWFSEKFIITLWTNRINWGIHIHDVSQINTLVTGSVEIFLTRTIQNLERSREKVNPNRTPQENNNSGLIDKIAFWRKEKEGRA